MASSGKTVTQAKKERRAAKIAAGKAKPKPDAIERALAGSAHPPTRERVEQAGGAEALLAGRKLAAALPAGLKQMARAGTLQRDELRAAALLLSDYRAGYESDMRITRYVEAVQGGGGFDGHEAQARVIDARRRYDGAIAAMTVDQRAVVVGVVVHGAARGRLVSPLLGRWSGEARMAASAFVLAEGLGVLSRYYRGNR